MGNVPRPYLGIASGILATMRNLGMVLGIAIGGAVLYAIVPASIPKKATLGASESILFLWRLKQAYLVGASSWGFSRSPCIHQKSMKALLD